MDVPTRDWTAPPREAAPPADAAPVPLHRLRAAEERAQRDRMILILLAFFVFALVASLGL